MNSTETRQNVHSLVDQLPPAQLAIIKDLLSVMLNPVARANAPIDDEPLTDEDAQAIRRSEAWFEKNGGKGIPMEEVLADFGLSIKDFPLEKHGA
ncbi:MAG TPA: hypothetical protein VGG97_14090 [Bryobacteraceae bacterium]|jgi:hypothetical protein